MRASQRVVIIGNGIAGATIAEILGKTKDFAITMISDESDLPFARTALMYVFMGQVSRTDTLLHQGEFWKNLNIDLITDRVYHLDRLQKTLELESGRNIEYDMLVIATGSKPIMPEFEGMISDQVHVLYHWTDLEKMKRQLKLSPQKAVIVGGGLIGIEMAGMWLSKGIEVNLLIREDSFWKSGLPAHESLLVQHHISAKGVNVICSDTLNALTYENNKLISVKTSRGRILPCDMLGIAIGVEPNIRWLQKSGLALNRGILVDPFLKTSDDAIFAAGDCVEFSEPGGKNKIEAIWHTSKKMGEVVAQHIMGKVRPYDVDVHYNGARFFDLEYQLYGQMSMIPSKNESHYFWQHPKGNCSLRLAFDDFQHLTGILSLGLRLRKAVCDTWIKNQAPLQQVLREMGSAHFDVEFSANRLSSIATEMKVITENNYISINQDTFNQIGHES